MYKHLQNLKAQKGCYDNLKNIKISKTEKYYCSTDQPYLPEGTAV